uniref:NADH-ubiquinone oxidoreductase chain 4L n=1 Tax=Somanniathelphusa bawangensis TaxID=2682932 RepID=A0A650F2W1_9EUCA|nr:NADH dehydrogenase subunit 4L [Somanniathelphusa grayi]QGT77252.1 NADH dehydrogenase subunit 4L [Somanniathelphusa bawangensis]UYP50877.1 NADH dehydrogenase subunit 4L [Somanniathelphusa grayi]
MMNLSFVWVFSSLMMVFCGLWSFAKSHKHMLNSLLSLEFMMLGVFSLMVLEVVSVGSEMYFVLFFLTLVACEGALGLSLLVFVVRSHGSDYLSVFNVLEC